MSIRFTINFPQLSMKSNSKSFLKLNISFTSKIWKRSKIKMSKNIFILEVLLMKLLPNTTLVVAMNFSPTLMDKVYLSKSFTFQCKNIYLLRNKKEDFLKLHKQEKAKIMWLLKWQKSKLEGSVNKIKNIWDSSLQDLQKDYSG